MKIYIQGYKSIRDGQFIAIGKRLTFLVGPNSAGKSVVLSALQKLSGETPEFTLDKNLIHKNPRKESIVSACHSLGIEWNVGKFKYGNFSTHSHDLVSEKIETSIYKNIHKHNQGVSTPSDENEEIRNCRLSIYTNNLLSIGINKLGSRQYDTVATNFLKMITLPFDQLLIEIDSINEKARCNFKEYMQWAIKIMKELRKIFYEKSNLKISVQSALFHQNEAAAAAEIISKWEACLSEGLFIWDFFLIRIAIRDSFSGLERQRMLNILERYNSKIEGYKSRLIKQVTATYPGRNFQLSIVSAERGLPLFDDLNCHLYAESDSNNIYHHLMQSKVDSIWDSSSDNSLSKPTATLFDRVNQALSNNLFTDNGYQVHVNSKALVSKEMWDERRSNMTEIDESEAEFLCELSLVDSHGRSLLFSEVGSGIGYVLPVLIESFHPGNTGKIVFLQQPELHLHPALQTNLTDVLIEASEDKRIIAETHSEHMILRALKRIRQTTNETIQDSTLKLMPDDVAVNYFEPLPDGSTKVHILRISNDGDFLDRWPNGFFEERERELFDE